MFYLRMVRVHGRGKISLVRIKLYNAGDRICINMHRSIHSSEYLLPFLFFDFAANKISVIEWTDTLVDFYLLAYR